LEVSHLQLAFKCWRAFPHTLDWRCLRLLFPRIVTIKLKKFLSYEWDAIAGIVTAVTASVLHLLHMLDEEVMLSVVLALIALLFINFMRHTRNNEITAEQVDRTEAEVRKRALIAARYRGWGR